MSFFPQILPQIERNKGMLHTVCILAKKNRESLKFYDEYEWLIGSSNIYQFTVYDSSSLAPPSVDVHSPIVYQDGNYYLVAMCKQFQSFPVQKLQFWKNGEPVGEITKDKELPLYLHAHSGTESKGHFRSSDAVNGQLERQKPWSEMLSRNKPNQHRKRTIIHCHCSHVQKSRINRLVWKWHCYSLVLIRKRYWRLFLRPVRSKRSALEWNVFRIDTL